MEKLEHVAEYLSARLNKEVDLYCFESDGSASYFGIGEDYQLAIKKVAGRKRLELRYQPSSMIPSEDYSPLPEIERDSYSYWQIANDDDIKLEEVVSWIKEESKDLLKHYIASMSEAIYNAINGFECGTRDLNEIDGVAMTDMGGDRYFVYLLDTSFEVNFSGNDDAEIVSRIKASLSETLSENKQ